MNEGPLLVVSEIVSGGQTGADRAALDVAKELGIPHGWFPRGRQAEDGAIDLCYIATGSVLICPISPTLHLVENRKFMT